MAKKKAKRQPKPAGSPSRKELQGAKKTRDQIRGARAVERMGGAPDTIEGQARYVKKKVHVKASKQQPAHEETRRIRVDTHGTARAERNSENLEKGPFANAVKSAGAGRDGPNWTGGPGSGSGRGGGGRDKEPPHSQSGDVPDPDENQGFQGYGYSETHFGNLSKDTSPGTVKNRVQSYAASLYHGYRESGETDSDAKNHAVEKAINEAHRKGLQISESSPAEIRRSAFGDTAKPAAGSSKEPKESEGKKKSRENITKIDEDIAARHRTRSKQQTELEETFPSTKKKLKPGDVVEKSKLSNQKFLRSRPSEEREWIDKQMDYGGIFYGAKGNQVPGAYRKWQRYVNAREAGHTDRDNIVEWLTTDTRGKRALKDTSDSGHFQKEAKEGVKATYTKGIVRKEGTTKRNRYKSLAPSHEDFGVGIRVPGLPSTGQLKDKYPDLSDRDIFEMREAHKQEIDTQLTENSREAHETRAATFLGRDKKDSSAGPDDRVTFFTTSTGWPAISVPAQSLVGQYVIKKRKKLLYDQKIASRAELKGEYPYAVRDQHIVEAATGLSVGAQGRYGAFKNIGYRVGTKKSTGYGKMIPVGSQILRDSSGQAIYDRNGNVRYSEGFSRPFDVRPSNDVGLKVYLG